MNQETQTPDPSWSSFSAAEAPYLMLCREIAAAVLAGQPRPSLIERLRN